MLRCVFAAAFALAVLSTPTATSAQRPIKVGVPLTLSGPVSPIGEAMLKGAQVFVEESNARGGVLGRRFELVVRDTRGDPAQAVQTARELILKENVDGLVGTLSAAESLAVSVVAKEHRTVFIVPVAKTDDLTAEQNLHPYVFRVAATTTTEGRSAAEIVAKWPVKRIATIGGDHAYGRDVTRAFIERITKIKPGVEIVDQQWLKVGEADYTSFISAQTAKKPEAVFSAISGIQFVTFVKQAKSLGYFDVIKHNFIGVGEAGSSDSTKAMGPDYPVGIWGNSYDAFYWEGGPPQHRDFIGRLSRSLKDDFPSSWAVQSYIALQFLAEAIKKAGTSDSEKVSKALLGLTVETPLGRMTIREKDHQANRGQLYGRTVKDPKYPFAIMKPLTYIDPTPFMD